MNSPPRIAICAAYKAGMELTPFILSFPFAVKFFVTCRMEDDPYEEEIASACKSAGVNVIRKQDVNDASFIAYLKEEEIDMVLLVWWPDIIKPLAIEAVKNGWINLHPSLLPYNRGKHPYYWAIVDGTPFGATMHYVTKGIDEGHILFQQTISVKPEDTGGSLYQKGYNACLNLFRDSYQKIVNMDLHPIAQDESVATFHLAKHLDPHSLINLNDTYVAKDLIYRLRARTFSNSPSSYVNIDGKDYYIRLYLEEKD